MNVQPEPAQQSRTAKTRRLGLRAALREVTWQPLNVLLVALPVALVLEWSHSNPLWVFAASCAAIIPLAGLMGRATEQLAETLGSGIGGLLNATFGNAAELIIALVALSRGPEMFPLVKASITGSIIGNILLVLGATFLLGGLRYRRQEFNRTAAGMGATLLALASVGLMIPTIYYYLFRASATLSPEETRTIESLSEEIAVILAVIYLLSLLFTLHTHSHLFAGPAAKEQQASEHVPWHGGLSLGVLLAATGAIAWMSELLVGSVEPAAESLGMSRVFVGVIVVAVIGNAAEHSTAILMGLKNKMDLALQIALGSGLQIVLFVVPALVFASLLMGIGQPMDLHFTVMEIVALVLSVAVVALICQDGESHWMEGVMLLGVYLMLALAFYYLPENAP